MTPKRWLVLLGGTAVGTFVWRGADRCPASLALADEQKHTHHPVGRGRGGRGHRVPRVVDQRDDLQLTAREEALVAQTHEYLVAPLAGKPSAWQDELNQLAQEGWELTDVISLSSHVSLAGEGPAEAVAFLKRPSRSSRDRAKNGPGTD